MRAFLALALKELRILSRDRHGLAVLFLMPAMFILIMSMAMRDALDPSRRGTIEYTLVDEDGGYFARTLDARLASQASLKRVDAGAPFTVRIAKGFDARIAADANGPRPPLLQLELSPTAPIPSRLLFVATVRATLAGVQAEYLMEDQMGVPHEDAEKLRAQTDASALPVAEVFTGAPAGGAAPNAVQQSVPAWLVFAMFFVVLPLGSSVLAEREQGNLQRLSLLNVTPMQLLAAKFPAYYAITLLQLAVMLGVGVWVVPRIGGDALSLSASHLPGLWLVCSALSVAAIGFGLLIAVVARSAIQASTFGAMANLLFGAVGGIMVPKLVMPEAMRALSNLSPMSWALEGCWDILLRGGGLMEVLPESAALTGFGLAAFTLATFLFPKTDS